MKKKLNLNDLKVKSFVTELDNSNNVVGASGIGCAIQGTQVCNVSQKVWSLCQTCGIYC